MSRKKKLSQGERRRFRRQRELDEEALIQDTAGLYACFFEAARTHVDLCKIRLEELDTATLFNRLAQEFWQNRPGRAAILHQALTDLLAEHLRYEDAIAKLEARFAALTDPEVHDHLAPIEEYRELTRRRLYPEKYPASKNE
jgi:hypothetical protein